jgi:excinuclease ABC subunit A
VDRIVIKPGLEQRLAESFETALGLADGIAVAEFADKSKDGESPRRVTFSAKFACPVSGFTISEIEPRLFSFNNPFGACPSCDGLGEQLKVDPALVVPDPDKSLNQGAIAPWGKAASPLQTQTLQALAKKYKFSLDTAWSKLKLDAKDLILNGTGEEEVDFVFDDGMRRYEVTKPFEGVVGNLERRFRETDSQWMREEIGRYQSAAPCPTCEGKRLRPEALSVKVSESTISDASLLPARAVNPVLIGEVRPDGPLAVLEVAGGALGDESLLAALHTP